MKLLTIQSKHTLEILNRENIYYANMLFGSDMSICPKLVTSMYRKMGNIYPIFTMRNFSNIYLNDYNKISEMPYLFIQNMKNILYAMQYPEERSYFDVILLEVPDDFGIATHLWGWRSQMIFEAQYDNKIIDEDSKWHSEYSIEPIENEDCQVLIPYIKPEFVLDYVNAEHLGYIFDSIIPAIITK